MTTRGLCGLAVQAMGGCLDHSDTLSVSALCAWQGRRFILRLSPEPVQPNCVVLGHLPRHRRPTGPVQPGPVVRGLASA
eukprot:290889-Amphidinium_carterae.1